MPTPSPRPDEPSCACVPCGDVRDRDLQHLVPIVSSILGSPPVSLPGWDHKVWRAAMRYRDMGPRPTPATVEHGRVRDSVLLAPVMSDLVRWAGSRRPLSFQLGSIAAALAVIDRAVTAGESDATVVASAVASTVDHVRALRYCPHPERARVVDGDELVGSWARAGDDGPSLVSLVVPRLLERAGFCPSADPVLARRIEAAVDVFLNWWVQGAPAGGGLPAFRRAQKGNHTHRLRHFLGDDRDLTALVEGPLPGNGRPFPVVRRTGLAYWVAVAIRAAFEGTPIPPVPAAVADHWRRELSRVGPPVTSSPAMEDPGNTAELA